MSKIITWPDVSGNSSEPGSAYTITEFIQRAWKSRHDSSPPDSQASTQVDAYINHSRWVVECPEGCGYAVIVDPAEPIFLCAICGSGWHEVSFPEQREEIESTLLVRPEAKLRNWSTETVQQLKEENITNGLD